MMNVTLRNFFRLLRAGAFGQQEQLEPLSAWKWKQLYRVAQMHGVTAYVDKGFERLQGQFFLQLPADLRDGKKTKELTIADEERKLTNPLLKKELKRIQSEEQADGGNSPTLELLNRLTSITTTTLSVGVPLRQLVELCLFLQQEGKNIDEQKLSAWTEQLHMQRMNQLTGALLVRLFHFAASDIPFMDAQNEVSTDDVVDDLFKEQAALSAKWSFQQGEDIFVHSDSSTMLRHVRHSARYFRYYPTESVTHFFSSFLRSLQNIEE